MNATSKRHAPGFTLIELMVVVAIISLLVGILIPGFKAVTRNAKNVATATRMAVLDRGLSTYRGEQALGGVYPPSHSDNPARWLEVQDPFDTTGNNVIEAISGANLLVYGLVGADQLGTPGFADLDGDGLWWNDQRSDVGGGGAYELDQTTLDPLVARYPGSGATYVDEATRASIKTLAQLSVARVVATPLTTSYLVDAAQQPFFTDAWDRPILYYRANRAARLMVNIPGGTPGTYDQRDNALFTGTIAPDVPGDLFGIDFGQGQVDDSDFYSKIHKTLGPPAQPDSNGNGVMDILEVNYPEFTFEQFILDTAVPARNTAVNRDKYLLISAGPDALYGSEDDVVNWTRE